MINKFGFLKDKKQQQKISNLISDNPSIKKQQFQAPLLSQPQPANLNKKHTYLNAQQYHPFQIPPNLHLASIHRKATQFGKINNQAILQAGQDLVCNCCMQHEKQQLAICCEGNEIYKVSESQGFYFEFIKVIVFALVMMFLVSGIDTMVSTERYCSKEVRKCIKIYRLFHVPQEISYDEVSDTILNILSAFFLYPFIFFLFYMKSKIHQKLMSTVIKMGDYSLMISGFDFQRITDKEIIQKLRPYSVESILFTHKIGDYLPTMQRRFILEAKKNLYFKRGYDEKYNKTLRQIYEIDNKILPFKNTMNIGNERQLRTDKIIVKFRTVQDKLIFIGEFHQSLCKRFVHVIQNKSSLEINQIPLYPQNLGQPQEIIWENLEVSSKYKFGVVLVNIVITFGILVISFIIIIQLTNLQNVNEQNDELFISFMIAFVIEIFNVALYLTISKMTQMERRITLTGKMMAKIIKNVCLFFFNTTLIPFSLFLLDKYSNDKTIVYEYIISLFFVNNLISPLSPLLNPFNLYKLYCIRKMRKQGKDCLFTQLQANQMYQKFNFQLQLKYQLLSQRILNSCFYAAFFPQVLILTIFGLILDYWIQKWWLLNYCCIPKFSARLGNVINQIALFFPTVYLFGYAANLLMLRGDKEVTFNTDVSIIVGFIILSLTISIIFLLFGKKWIEKYLKKHKPPSSIDQSISIKQLDYCDLNPTSFLHIDLQNQLNITHNFRNQQPQNNFSKIQQFVIKRKQKQLKRTDQQRQIRISHLQNLYDSP